MAAPPARYSSVFELARTLPNSAAFSRLYELHMGFPRCRASPELERKYGVAQDNTQAVLRISNRVTLAQTWYNEERTRKPQTFAAPAADAAVLDPTKGGGPSCDFCNWQTLTATDTWGRVEGPHAVSASNLFRYVQPCQGERLARVAAASACACSQHTPLPACRPPCARCPRPVQASSCLSTTTRWPSAWSS